MLNEKEYNEITNQLRQMEDNLLALRHIVRSIYGPVQQLEPEKSSKLYVVTFRTLQEAVKVSDALQNAGIHCGIPTEHQTALQNGEIRYLLWDTKDPRTTSWGSVEFKYVGTYVSPASLMLMVNDLGL